MKTAKQLTTEKCFVFNSKAAEQLQSPLMWGPFLKQIYLYSGIIQTLTK